MSGDDPRKSNGADDPNVVRLADVRKRQRTVRLDKNKEKSDARSGASAGRGKSPYGNSRKSGNEPDTPLKKLLQYGQFLLFLAVIAYFMSLCRGPV